MTGGEIVNIAKWTAIGTLATAVTGQQVGWVQPAIEEEIETAAVAEIIGDELQACFDRNTELIDRLMACVESCQ